MDPKDDTTQSSGLGGVKGTQEEPVAVPETPPVTPGAPEPIVTGTSDEPVGSSAMPTPPKITVAGEEPSSKEPVVEEPEPEESDLNKPEEPGAGGEDTTSGSV